MTTVIINDVAVEALPGDGLLDVARRNRAHIGFVCDGNGLCTTCECLVLVGAENLSVPNRAERDWLPPARLAKGYRLACQSTLNGLGPVAVLTRAEEVRRLWNNMVNAPTDSTYDQNWRRFVSYSVQLTTDHLSMFPMNLARTVARLGIVRTILPVQDNNRWFRDIGRVIDERTDDAASQI